MALLRLFTYRSTTSRLFHPRFVRSASVEGSVAVVWQCCSRPAGAAFDRRLSFCTPRVASRTHHLHVVEKRSEEWRGWLAFRDYLRRHPDTAAEYEDLKRRLAAAHGRDPNDRRAYREGKADFISRVTTLAIEKMECPT